MEKVVRKKIQKIQKIQRKYIKKKKLRKETV